MRILRFVLYPLLKEIPHPIFLLRMFQNHDKQRYFQYFLNDGGKEKVGQIERERAETEKVFYLPRPYFSHFSMNKNYKIQNYNCNYSSPKFVKCAMAGAQ